MVELQNEVKKYKYFVYYSILFTPEGLVAAEHTNSFEANAIVQIDYPINERAIAEIKASLLADFKGQNPRTWGMGEVMIKSIRPIA